MDHQAYEIMILRLLKDTAVFIWVYKQFESLIVKGIMK